MKKLFFVMFAFACVNINAQFTDSFKQNSFAGWLGDTAKFTRGDQQIQSNSGISNDIFLISQPLNNNNAREYIINLTLNFNTSSVNFCQFVLDANKENLAAADTALYLKIGDTKDEVSLYQFTNGTTTLLIDGEDNVTRFSSNKLRIKVTIDQDSISLEYTTNPLSDAYTFRGSSAFDTLNLVKTNKHLGIIVRQTTPSFFYKHFFYSIYAGAIIKDTTAPKLLKHYLLNDSTLALLFSEKINARLLNKPANYVLNNSNLAKNISSYNQDSAVLTFTNPFISGQINSLKIDSLMDLFGNLNTQEQIAFPFQKIDLPVYGDLLITEIYAKPASNNLLVEAFEIYNSSNKYLDISGMEMKDLTTDEPFPSLILKPNTYYVVCDDSDTAFFSGKNTVPLKTMPSLNDANDLISILDKEKSLVATVNYKQEWHSQGKESGGWSLEMKDLAKGCYLAENFSSSVNSNGNTLGFKNSIAEVLRPLEGIKIEKIYLSNKRSIRINWSRELDFSFITSKNNYALGNGLLIDSIAFEINKPTEVFLFLNSDINAATVLQVKGTTDCSGGLIEAQEFAIDFPKLTAKGDLMVTEIMFNSLTGCSEYLEIDNQTNGFIDLRNVFLNVKSATKNKTINISENGEMLKPSQKLVLVQNTAQLNCYALCTDAFIIELKNWETLDDKEGSIALYNANQSVIDSVRYSANWHSVLLNDENGVSLEKIDTNQSGFLANAWASSSTAVNYASPGCANALVKLRESADIFSLGSPYFQRINPAFSQAAIQYQLDKANYSINITISDKNGMLVRRLANNELSQQNGTYFWDGTSEAGKNAAVGIYYIYITATHANGKKHQKILEVTKLD